MEKNKNIIVEIKKNTSGAACGKQYICIKDKNDNNVIGCIQPTNLDFGTDMPCASKVFIASQCYMDWKTECVSTFMDACNFLNVDSDTVCELLPREGWDEFWRKYFI